MSSILLYNHGGCQNGGCEAIVRTTSALFAQAGMDVVLASDQSQYDRMAGLSDVKRIVHSTISPLSLDRVINSIGFRLGMPREEEVARKHAPVLRAGRRSDICLSIGGDTYCYGRPEHLYVINRKLKRAKKPTVLWGCSIEPELLEGEMLEDLRSYDLIVAREPITYEAVKSAGLPAFLACDPAFTLDTVCLPLPESWREGKTIGLNVSPLVLNKAKDRKKAMDAFVSMIRHILETGDDAVALIPHVTWAHDSDLDALQEIQSHFTDEPRVFMLPGDLRATELKGYISRLKALVTARTHASIAAYSSAVPTLVVGYSIKARGIARGLFGDETGHLIPVQELHDAAQLIGAYDAMIARAEAERELLSRSLPAYMEGLHDAVQAVLALQKRL